MWAVASVASLALSRLPRDDIGSNTSFARARVSTPLSKGTHACKGRNRWPRQRSASNARLSTVEYVEMRHLPSLFGNSTLAAENTISGTLDRAHFDEYGCRKQIRAVIARRSRQLAESRSQT